ncbi:hypothetical protein RRG08_018584 [Elysia crispata]|uniref:Uncharacterized protein n=1 Tax=Elysia crispata TaxID=231223 RepID=A0AAE1DUP0_9GAST|nr:hypothetical protein RRG08_018584 [Elysia crispata]
MYTDQIVNISIFLQLTKVALVLHRFRSKKKIVVRLSEKPEVSGHCRPPLSSQVELLGHQFSPICLPHARSEYEGCDD